MPKITQITFPSPVPAGVAKQIFSATGAATASGEYLPTDTGAPDLDAQPGDVTLSLAYVGDTGLTGPASTLVLNVPSPPPPPAPAVPPAAPGPLSAQVVSDPPADAPAAVVNPSPAAPASDPSPPPETPAASAPATDTAAPAAPQPAADPNAAAPAPAAAPATV